MCTISQLKGRHNIPLLLSLSSLSLWRPPFSLHPLPVRLIVFPPPQSRIYCSSETPQNTSRGLQRWTNPHMDRAEEKPGQREGEKESQFLKKNGLFGLSGCWTLLIVELIKNQVGGKCYRLDAQGLSCRTHNPTNTHTDTHTYIHKHSALILRELKLSRAKHLPAKLSPTPAACILLISFALPRVCVCLAISWKVIKKAWEKGKKEHTVIFFSLFFSDYQSIFLEMSFAIFLQGCTINRNKAKILIWHCAMIKSQRLWFN